MINCIYVLFVASMLAACGAVTPVRNIPNEQNSQVSKSVTNKDKYESFCEMTVDKFREGERESIGELFSLTAMGRSALFGVEAAAEIKRELQRGLKPAFEGKIIELADTAAQFENWYGIESRDKKNCAIHSSFDEQVGLVIIQFKLANINGEVKIVDWFDLYSFQQMAPTLAGLIRQIIEESLKPEAGAGQAAVLKFLATLKKQDVEASWQAYQALSEPLYSDPVTVGALAKLVEPETDAYIEVMERYLALTPEDEQGLAFYDYFLTIGDFSKALGVVDNIERVVGQDAVLELLRASVYSYSDTPKEFLAHLYNAIDLGVGLEDNYWVAMNFFLEHQLFSEAVLTLDALREAFGYSFSADSFDSLDEYKELINSDAFKVWNVSL